MWEKINTTQRICWADTGISFGRSLWHCFLQILLHHLAESIFKHQSFSGRLGSFNPLPDCLHFLPPKLFTPAYCPLHTALLLEEGFNQTDFEKLVTMCCALNFLPVIISGKSQHGGGSFACIWEASQTLWISGNTAWFCFSPVLQTVFSTGTSSAPVQTIYCNLEFLPPILSLLHFYWNNQMSLISLPSHPYPNTTPDHLQYFWARISTLRTSWGTQSDWHREGFLCPGANKQIILNGGDFLLGTDERQNFAPSHCFGFPLDVCPFSCFPTFVMYSFSLSFAEGSTRPDTEQFPGRRGTSDGPETNFGSHLKPQMHETSFAALTFHINSISIGQEHWRHVDSTFPSLTSGATG